MAVNDGIGYYFPDPIDPGAVVCIKVYVPKDPLYLGAFWRSYDYLATWIAWAKDEAHTGADVAAIWRPLVEQARAEYEAGEECGPMFDVRVSPDNACTLQKFIDGEWVDFWQAIDCLDSLYPGPEPPYPVPVGPDNPALLSAANIVNWLHDLIDDILADLDFAMPVPEIVANLADLLRDLNPGVDWWSIAASMVDKLADAPYQELIDQMATADYWQPFFEEVACKSEADGSFLDVWADALYQWLNDSADGIYQALSDLAGVIDGDGWTRINNRGVGTAGFGPDDFDAPTCDLPAVKAIYLGEWTPFDYINLTTYPPAIVSEPQSVLSESDDRIVGILGELLWWNKPDIRLFKIQGQATGDYVVTNWNQMLNSSLIPPAYADATGETHVYMHSGDYGDGQGSVGGADHAEYYFPNADMWISGGPKTLIPGDGMPVYFNCTTETDHAISAGDRHAAFRVRLIYLRS